MAIETLLQQVYDLPLSQAIREGSNLFPWIETLHVLSVVTVVGTILIVDLRLIGLPSHKRSVSKLTEELLPFTWVAFAGAVISGSLLFMSNAMTYFNNGHFRLKMILLVLAGLNMAIFHLVTQRDLEAWDERLKTPVGARIAGVSSLALWAAVVFFGRWIGFSLESHF